MLGGCTPGVRVISVQHAPITSSPGDARGVQVFEKGNGMFAAQPSPRFEVADGEASTGIDPGPQFAYEVVDGALGDHVLWDGVRAPHDR